MAGNCRACHHPHPPLGDESAPVGTYAFTTIEYHFDDELEANWLSVELQFEGNEPACRFTKLRTPNIYAGEGSLYE